MLLSDMREMFGNCIYKVENFLRVYINNENY